MVSNFNNINTRTLSKASSSSVEAPITIGYSNWAGWWLWSVSEEEGLFAKNGVDVELLGYDSYLESIKALAAGHIDGNS